MRLRRYARSRGAGRSPVPRVAAVWRGLQLWRGSQPSDVRPVARVAGGAGRSRPTLGWRGSRWRGSPVARVAAGGAGRSRPTLGPGGAGRSRPTLGQSGDKCSTNFCRKAAVTTSNVET